MGPKVEAALEFLGGAARGARAVIGRLDRLPELVEGKSGTVIEEGE